MMAAYIAHSSAPKLKLQNGEEFLLFNSQDTYETEIASMANVCATYGVTKVFVEEDRFLAFAETLNEILSSKYSVTEPVTMEVV